MNCVIDENFWKTLFQSLFLPLKFKEIDFLSEVVSLLGVEEKAQELFLSQVCRLLLRLAERRRWSLVGHGSTWRGLSVSCSSQPTGWARSP